MSTNVLTIADLTNTLAEQAGTTKKAATKKPESGQNLASL